MSNVIKLIGNKEKQHYIEKSICLLATHFTYYPPVYTHYQATLLSIKKIFLTSIFPLHIKAHLSK